MNKGFTLIEMLVVLAIIGVITGIVVFNIGSEKQNSALLRSAQNLSLNLRRAQNFALSSKNFKTSSVPCSWGVHFNTDSKSYVIFADLASAQDCSDKNLVRNSDGSEDFEAVNLDAGVTVISSFTDVVFTPPDPIVNFTPDPTSASITLTNKNGATKVIIINKAGFISSP